MLPFSLLGAQEPENAGEQRPRNVRHKGGPKESREEPPPFENLDAQRRRKETGRDGQSVQALAPIPRWQKEVSQCTSYVYYCTGQKKRGVGTAGAEQSHRAEQEYEILIVSSAVALSGERESKKATVCGQKKGITNQQTPPSLGTCQTDLSRSDRPPLSEDTYLLRHPFFTPSSCTSSSSSPTSLVRD